MILYVCTQKIEKEHIIIVPETKMYKVSIGFKTSFEMVAGDGSSEPSASCLQLSTAQPHSTAKRTLMDYSFVS